MDVAIGVTFLGLELAFIALVLLAIVRTGFVRLSSPIGIARDGVTRDEKEVTGRLPTSLVGGDRPRSVQGHDSARARGRHGQLRHLRTLRVASVASVQ